MIPSRDEAPPGDPGGVRRSPVDLGAADLVRRLRRWTPAGWTVPAEPPAAGTRADATAAAVQRIADIGADAEQRPRRPVPRLADKALADQLAVVVDDVVRTGELTVMDATAAELRALRAALGLRPDR